MDLGIESNCGLTKIKGGDVLSHTVRHEPAVEVSSPDPPLYGMIIQETEQVVIINKPATIPIHPVVDIMSKSLMNILETHYQRKLYTILQSIVWNRSINVWFGHFLQIINGGTRMWQTDRESRLSKGGFGKCSMEGLMELSLQFDSIYICFNCCCLTAQSVDVPWHGEWNDCLVPNKDDHDLQLDMN
jgi:hypothetical protein